MRPDDTLNSLLPDILSDEAAYELYDLQQRLADTIERRYHRQIRRYLQNCQRGLFADEEGFDDDLSF
jgi:hypothetical protein